MYTLKEYGNMIADRVRMDAYAYALKAAVKQGSVVLDIGAATGIHALLACKFGARKVYAVESNEAIYLAQELAQENGFAEQIEFIHNLSTQVTLPEQADVIVSDLRGILPLYGFHIPAIVDARLRHLAPGGLLIPKRDMLWAALVAAESIYNELITPWDSPYGLSMSAAKQIALNKWTQDGTESIRRTHLITVPQIWAVLDYATIENADVEATIVTQATRAGTAHGLLIWFDAEIADGIGFSNDPQANKMAEVYGRAFFPLLEPVKLIKGDSVKLNIRAELIDGTYDWHWHTQIYAQDDPEVLRADFRQSTTSESSLNIEHIANLASDRQPSLTEDAAVALFVLGLVNGRNTIAAITKQTQAKFPGHFKNYKQTLSYVYELTQAYQQ